MASPCTLQMVAGQRLEQKKKWHSQRKQIDLRGKVKQIFPGKFTADCLLFTAKQELTPLCYFSSFFCFCWYPWHFEDSQFNRSILPNANKAMCDNFHILVVGFFWYDYHKSVTIQIFFFFFNSSALLYKHCVRFRRELEMSLVQLLISMSHCGCVGVWSTSFSSLKCGQH